MFCGLVYCAAVMMLIGLFCSPPLSPIIESAIKSKNASELVVYQYFKFVVTAGFTLVFLVKMMIAIRKTMKTNTINQKSTRNCVTKPPWLSSVCCMKPNSSEVIRLSI